jgi:hypothetical protein
MKKVLCLLGIIIFFSCNKNNKSPTIIVENNNSFSSVENSDEFIKREDYKLSVGNISVIIPSDYAVSYYDGVEHKSITLHNLDITGAGYIKTFRIEFFRKDGDYESDFGGYGVSSLSALIDYVDGTTKKKPNFFVSSMRRNTFKEINICETLTLSRFVIDDTIFEHQIIFTDDEYCYIMHIRFWGNDFDKEIMYELPDYFDDNGWIIKKINEIYDQFINFQKMPEYIEKLYEETISVFNTLEFKK